MPSSLRSLLVRVLFVTALLAGAPPILAQTHLGVPAKQLVELQFYANSNDPTGAYSWLCLFKADGTLVNNWTIPAGQALVLLDVQVQGMQVPASSGMVYNSVWIVKKYAVSPNSMNFMAAVPLTIPAHPGNNMAFQANLSFTAGLVFTAATPPALLPQVSGGSNYNLRATGYLTTY